MPRRSQSSALRVAAAFSVMLPQLARHTPSSFPSSLAKHCLAVNFYLGAVSWEIQSKTGDFSGNLCQRCGGSRTTLPERSQISRDRGSSRGTAGVLAGSRGQVAPRMRSTSAPGVIPGSSTSVRSVVTPPIRHTACGSLLLRVTERRRLLGGGSDWCGGMALAHRASAGSELSHLQPQEPSRTCWKMNEEDGSLDISA